LQEEIIKIILDEAIYIHKSIGPGMLETVYKTCLAYRLENRDLYAEIEKAVPVIFEEVKMECGYRMVIRAGHKVHEGSQCAQRRVLCASLVFFVTFYLKRDL
jgi:GxxExxY protein